MLTDLTPVPAAALPVSDLAAYLRLSRGFADDGALDAHLEACLRSALAAVEARTGKAVFRRDFLLALPDWAGPDRQPLPVAPAVSVSSVTVLTRTGMATAVEAAALDLVADAHRPVLRPVSGRLPDPGPGGAVEIVFRAGYAETWSDLPPALRQAVLLLAAGFFAQDADAGGGVPATVAVLLEPFRSIRLRGAGA
jgi:uncharacterized phiE125 gp8 family phage protein